MFVWPQEASALDVERDMRVAHFAWILQEIRFLPKYSHEQRFYYTPKKVFNQGLKLNIQWICIASEAIVIMA